MMKESNLSNEEFYRKYNIPKKNIVEPEAWKKEAYHRMRKLQWQKSMVTTFEEIMTKIRNCELGTDSNDISDLLRTVFRHYNSNKFGNKNNNWSYYNQLNPENPLTAEMIVAAYIGAISKLEPGEGLKIAQDGWHEVHNPNNCHNLDPSERMDISNEISKILAALMGDDPDVQNTKQLRDFANTLFGNAFVGDCMCAWNINLEAKGYFATVKDLRGPEGCLSYGVDGENSGENCIDYANRYEEWLKTQGGVDNEIDGEDGEQKINSNNVNNVSNHHNDGKNHNNKNKKLSYSKTNNNNDAAIYGGIFGSIAFLGTVVGVIGYKRGWWCKKKNNKANPQINNKSTKYALPDQISKKMEENMKGNNKVVEILSNQNDEHSLNGNTDSERTTKNVPHSIYTQNSKLYNQDGITVKVSQGDFQDKEGNREQDKEINL